MAANLALAPLPQDIPKVIIFNILYQFCASRILDNVVTNGFKRLFSRYESVAKAVLPYGTNLLANFVDAIRRTPFDSTNNRFQRMPFL